MVSKTYSFPGGINITGDEAYMYTVEQLDMVNATSGGASIAYDITIAPIGTTGFTLTLTNPVVSMS